MRSMVLAIVVFSISSVAHAKTLTLGKLQSPGEGCGCNFKMKESKIGYLWSELGEFATSEQILINVDGKDIKLIKKNSDFPDSKRNPNRLEPKKGDQLKETFEGGGFKAILNFTVLGKCPEFKEVPESCEYIGYDLDLEVSRTSYSSSRTRLSGHCGC